MTHQLKDQQIELVRSSWKKVTPNGQQHGELLLHKLFELSPPLMDLFPFGSDLSSPLFTAHALNVVNALDFAVQNLDNPGLLVPKLKELGRVHAMFELTEKEFELIGQALLWVLERGLGDDFTPQLRRAWCVVHGVITDVMLSSIQEFNSD